MAEKVILEEALRAGLIKAKAENYPFSNLIMFTKGGFEYSGDSLIGASNALNIPHREIGNLVHFMKTYALNYIACHTEGPGVANSGYLDLRREIVAAYDGLETGIKLCLYGGRGL